MCIDSIVSRATPLAAAATGMENAVRSGSKASGAMKPIPWSREEERAWRRRRREVGFSSGKTKNGWIVSPLGDGIGEAGASCRSPRVGRGGVWCGFHCSMSWWFRFAGDLIPLFVDTRGLMVLTKIRGNVRNLGKCSKVKGKFKTWGNV